MSRYYFLGWVRRPRGRQCHRCASFVALMTHGLRQVGWRLTTFLECEEQSIGSMGG